MFPSDFLTITQKTGHVYESFCTSVCKKYGLNQSAFDLILFLANNPSLNTARDVCEIRGIKKGIVSVTIEKLVKDGYLIREDDPSDRRIVRLFLTEKCDPVVADGRAAQEHFFHAISSGLSMEEFVMFESILGKIKKKIVDLEKEI